MKNYLLLVVACLWMVNSFSQSLTLSDVNGAIDPSVIYHVLGDPSQVEPMKASIYVTNSGASTIDVGCKKVITEGDTLTGTSNYFCWGVCYPSWVYVSPINVTIEPGQTITDFFGDYEPKGVSGKSYITYTWFDANNPNDSISLEVEFNASPAGIKDPVNGTVLSAYPNPANDKFTVEYMLPEMTSNAVLVVSNILGAKMSETSLDEASGKVTLNTHALGNGIYFYSILVDGKMLETSKLVVRH